MSTFDERMNRLVAAEFGLAATKAVEQKVTTLEGEVGIRGYPLGSLRRSLFGERTDVGDIDLLVVPDRDGVVEGMTELHLPKWLRATRAKASGWLSLGDRRMMVDAWWCPFASRGPFALFLTGPGSLNVWMRQETNRRTPGLMLSQYGLFEAVPNPDDPKKRTTGRRVDEPEPDPDGSLVDGERWFWSEWCRLVGVDLPYPEAGVRSTLAARAREK